MPAEPAIPPAKQALRCERDGGNAASSDPEPLRQTAVAEFMPTQKSAALASAAQALVAHHTSASASGLEQSQAQTPALSDIAPESRQVMRLIDVTTSTCEYLRWCTHASGATAVVAALALLASGRGPARLPACEQILRHMRLTDHLRPLLLRTLSLFGPGELRAVRVVDYCAHHSSLVQGNFGRCVSSTRIAST
jgi:hypothetical protein